MRRRRTMHARLVRLTTLPAVLMLLVSCDKREEVRTDATATRQEVPVPMRYDAAAVLRDRIEKDSAFKQQHSPVPDEARAGFNGLRYYPVDPLLAIRTRLARSPQPDTVKLAATRGDVRTMLRYGIFTFTAYDTRCTLAAYVMPDHPGSLFVPFKDATNGHETYDVGRYIDLEMRDDDIYVLDFNRAYNPYCAYNPRFTCPIVPKENHLSVALRAGERLPPFGDHAAPHR